MKTLKIASIAAAVLAATTFSSVAQAEVSANFGATSNYLWRGVSQSSDGVSLSGGLDYSHENGFYAGTWVGTIDFGTDAGTGTENDYYLGYSGETESFGYDVGYIYYNYPADGYEGSDFGELYINFSLENLSFGVAYTVNSQVDDDAAFGTGDVYASAGYTFELPSDYSLTVGGGVYAFDSNDSDDDYAHIQFDVAKDDFTFTVSKAESSNVSDSETKFALSWGASF